MWRLVVQKDLQRPEIETRQRGDRCGGYLRARQRQMSQIDAARELRQELLVNISLYPDLQRKQVWDELREGVHEIRRRDERRDGTVREEEKPHGLS